MSSTCSFRIDITLTDVNGVNLYFMTEKIQPKLLPVAGVYSFIYFYSQDTRERTQNTALILTCLHANSTSSPAFNMKNEGVAPCSLKKLVHFFKGSHQCWDFIHHRS